MLQDPDLLSIQEVRSKVEQAYKAWLAFRSFSQEQVDAIIEAMGTAARAASRQLAELAVEETRYGNARDKNIKNLLAADILPRRMRGMKTVGIVRELPDEKVVEFGVPMGVVAAILPTTNPTSTAIYKALISVKAGNAVVLSPHPRAFRCTCSTIDILARAAASAGAPDGLIQCVQTATMDGTTALMKHALTAVILATGGSAMVKAAYSSGKPAYGVGPGNVPVLIDASADIDDAVAKVVAGKSFDYGTLCSSEQAIVAESSLRNRITDLLRGNHAYIADEKQTAALAKLLITRTFGVNPECVGQSPQKIAGMAGFEVPPDTSVIVVELAGIGKEHPLSAEKLSPVLSLHFVRDFPAALDACEALLRFGGLGHTAVIHSRDDARTREFGRRMPAMRMLVNTPAPQGSTGITTNLFPALTLGCGAVANNATSDNIGPQHLFNIKRLAWSARKPEEAFETPLEYSTAAPAHAALPVIDRRTVVSAVERYLAGKGFASSSTEPSVAAEVVDRFLAKRGYSEPAAEPRRSEPAPAEPKPAESSGGYG
jgi:acyl-CoA reductase-like NAD-dependent aldehyde dehydrogenase